MTTDVGGERHDAERAGEVAAGVTPPGGDLFAGLQFDLADADVTLFPGWCDVAEADTWFDELHAAIPWRQDTITLFGRTSLVPRLSAWHGDPGAVYGYSHIRLQPEPWREPLSTIRARVEADCDVAFNSVLCNLYRDGRDGVAWHADDEPELGPAPVIASLSLGAMRRFQLRRRDDGGRRHDIDLTHGSLLVMRAGTQRHWLHQIPKTGSDVGPRINLTFRLVA